MSLWSTRVMPASMIDFETSLLPVCDGLFIVCHDNVLLPGHVNAVLQACRWTVPFIVIYNHTDRQIDQKVALGPQNGTSVVNCWSWWTVSWGKHDRKTDARMAPVYCVSSKGFFRASDAWFCGNEKWGCGELLSDGRKYLAEGHPRNRAEQDFCLTQRLIMNLTQRNNPHWNGILTVALSRLKFRAWECFVEKWSTDFIVLVSDWEIEWKERFNFLRW